MTEISEVSVEDQLRNELRDVRHDLEHVVQERDELERQRQAVLDRLDQLDENGSVLSADCAPYVTVSSISSQQIRDLLKEQS